MYCRTSWKVYHSDGQDDPIAPEKGWTSFYCSCCSCCCRLFALTNSKSALLITWILFVRYVFLCMLLKSMLYKFLYSAVSFWLEWIDQHIFFAPVLVSFFFIIHLFYTYKFFRQWHLTANDRRKWDILYSYINDVQIYNVFVLKTEFRIPFKFWDEQLWTACLQTVIYWQASIQVF